MRARRRCRPTFRVGQHVHWWLGPPPGYLDRAGVRREVLEALAEWAEVVPLFFDEVCDLHFLSLPPSRLAAP